MSAEDEEGRGRGGSASKDVRWGAQRRAMYTQHYQNVQSQACGGAFMGRKQLLRPGSVGEARANCHKGRERRRKGWDGGGCRVGETGGADAEDGAEAALGCVDGGVQVNELLELSQACPVGCGLTGHIPYRANTSDVD